MNEAKRFLRILVPGFVFLTEFGILLFVWRGTETLQTLKVEGNIKELDFLVTALIVSGGIGFLLSSLHHYVYSTIYPRLTRWFSGHALYRDHRGFVEHAMWCGTLHVTERQGPRLCVTLPDARPLTDRTIWLICTFLWESCVDLDGSPVKGARDDNDRANDILHGNGTTLAGAFIAGLIWFAIVLPNHGLDWSTWIRQPPDARTLATFAVWFLLLWLHVWSYSSSVLYQRRLAAR